MVRYRDVHGCHTGDIDDDDFRAVRSNPAQELLRQLPGALRVDDADDGKNQQPLANLQHRSGEFADCFLLLANNAFALLHEADCHRVCDAVCRRLVGVQDAIQLLEIVLVFRK